MAHTLETRLEARRLAEQGISLAKVAEYLNGKGIQIVDTTLERWASREKWMIGRRARQALNSCNSATITINRAYQPPQAAPQAAPQAVPQAVPQADSGSILCNDGQAYELREYRPETPGNAGKMGQQAGQGERVGNPPPENSDFLPKNPISPADSRGKLPENTTKTPCPPHLFLDPPKTPQSGCDLTENPAGKPVPVGEKWPLIGQFQRPATIAEMLPQDFDGFQQVLRDSDQLAKMEAIRAIAYRENISQTLLKLSQYAVQLADSDPRLALQVMDKIAKLDGVGGKRFRLDESGGESKAGEQMRKVSAAAEDGGGVVVVVDVDPAGE